VLKRLHLCLLTCSGGYVGTERQTKFSVRNACAGLYTKRTHAGVWRCMLAEPTMVCVKRAGGILNPCQLSHVTARTAANNTVCSTCPPSRK
jgi:hypothetical protein